MGIFSKKNKQEPIESKQASERIEFLLLDSISDDKLLELADKLKAHIPLTINFNFEHVDDINKSIAFLSGVTYALEGEVMVVEKKIFMFASYHALEDGSLKEFIKDLN